MIWLVAGLFVAAVAGVSYGIYASERNYKEQMQTQMTTYEASLESYYGETIKNTYVDLLDYYSQLTTAYQNLDLTNQSIADYEYMINGTDTSSVMSQTKTALETAITNAQTAKTTYQQESVLQVEAAYQEAYEQVSSYNAEKALANVAASASGGGVSATTAYAKRLTQTIQLYVGDDGKVNEGEGGTFAKNMAVLRSQISYNLDVLDAQIQEANLAYQSQMQQWELAYKQDVKNKAGYEMTISTMESNIADAKEMLNYYQSVVNEKLEDWKTAAKNAGKSDEEISTFVTTWQNRFTAQKAEKDELVAEAENKANEIIAETTGE